jgi:hypothetical protein
MREKRYSTGALLVLSVRTKLMFASWTVDCCMVCHLNIVIQRSQIPCTKKRCGQADPAMYACGVDIVGCVACLCAVVQTAELLQRQLPGYRLYSRMISVACQRIDPHNVISLTWNLFWA